MDEEVWAEILGFPGYLVSNYGHIFNKRRERMMSTSLNNHGYVKISLYGEDGERHTQLVAPMVGEAFVERPDRRCRNIMALDGDLSNVVAWNLVWRPSGFVWRYYHQLRTPQPGYFQNLPVVDMTRAKQYDSIIEAGMVNGQMFEDIWRSTYSGDAIFPYHSVYRVIL